MTDRRWRIVLVPPGTGVSKAVELSGRFLRVAAGAAIVFVLGALLLGYATVSRSLDLARADRVERENARLSEELGILHSRVSALSDTVRAIAVHDSRIRLLANLDPNDPSVQLAGIGGPRDARQLTTTGGILDRRSREIRVDLDALIRRANLLASSFTEAVDSLTIHRARIDATPSIMPTAGWLSSAFNASRMHPILHINRPHEGIDVSAPMGAPIEAPADGTVISVGWETGYGNTLEIDHGFGIVTRYAHASRLLVRKGQFVHRGDRVALVGNTGLATGPHLHYEVHVNGKPVDPLRYVLPEAIVD
ncbi:MAG TPA: M23 family metallopeptidase [Gemmatimonadales bacterium]|nr:M23 family metallopeptidase [Gemmatimonadales bacterium]